MPCRYATFALNRGAVGAGRAAGLPASYCAMAQPLKRVRPTEAWYRGDGDTQPDCFAGFTPGSAHAPGEALVAVGPVGTGVLAYVGDLGGEAATGDVILAICGIQ